MKERILLAIDTNQDESRLETSKKLLKRFVLQKQQLIPSQEFGIVTLNDGTVWNVPFTADSSLIYSSIDAIVAQTNVVWSISSLFECIHECIDVTEIFRVILIYTRSNCIPRIDTVICTIS